METYIHIGYPKTATTFLQYELFDRLDGFINIGIPKTKQDEDYAKFKNRLFKTLVLEFEDQRKYINKFLKTLKNKRKNKLIFSHESISVNRWVGRRTIARRLSNFFPGSNILITIRNQYDLLKSMFKQTLKEGSRRNERIFDFEEWIEKLWKNRHIRSRLHYYKYNKVIQEYVNLFGSNNVTIALFEELENKEKVFGEKIAKFLEIDLDRIIGKLDSPPRNTSISERYKKFQKIRHKFNLDSNLFPFIPDKIKDFLVLRFFKKGKKLGLKYPEDLRENIKNFYRSANRDLLGTVKLPIDRFNYPL